MFARFESGGASEELEYRTLKHAVVSGGAAPVLMEALLKKRTALVEVATDEFIDFGEGIDPFGELGVEFELPGDFPGVLERVAVCSE